MPERAEIEAVACRGEGDAWFCIGEELRERIASLQAELDRVRDARDDEALRKIRDLAANNHVGALHACLEIHKIAAAALAARVPAGRGPRGAGIEAAHAAQRAVRRGGQVTTWKQIDPAVYRQGWDAALAGKTRDACDFFGSGPRAAWNEGYSDALREREKDTFGARGQGEQRHD